MDATDKCLNDEQTRRRNNMNITISVLIRIVMCAIIISVVVFAAYCVYTSIRYGRTKYTGKHFKPVKRGARRRRIK